VKFRTLFFDLDDTLYTKESGVWEALRRRIEAYMHERTGIPAGDVPKVRESYLAQYGTTLRGLLADYAVDPEEYMEFVHDVPIEKMISPNKPLADMLAQLPQRKWIFTNSSNAHSTRVLKALGIDDQFEGILDSKAMGYRSKPEIELYQLALRSAGNAPPTGSVFIDDKWENLGPAKLLGAATVIVGNGRNPEADYSVERVEELLIAFPALVE
jgi:putative hydrolase of the HAD superfamily